MDIPESIKRYQDTLSYARSKVDFVVGFDLYMMPSDMDLYIGKINGYNNLLIDASESDIPLVLGHNQRVNDLPPIPQMEESQDLPAMDNPKSQVDPIPFNMTVMKPGVWGCPPQVCLLLYQHVCLLLPGV